MIVINFVYLYCFVNCIFVLVCQIFLYLYCWNMNFAVYKLLKYISDFILKVEIYITGEQVLVRQWYRTYRWRTCNWFASGIALTTGKHHVRQR